MEDVFAIQDEIAQNIARALRVMLTEQEKRVIQKVPTRDVQACDYYLRGIGQASQRYACCRSRPARTHGRAIPSDGYAPRCAD